MIDSRLMDAAPQSLPEVHGSISTSQLGLWKRIFAFSGPAYLVSVGYMDPGNWATDLEGGAKFGYQLLWVLLMSNLMALLLQTLSARLGIVSGRDLAQACRETYPRFISYSLWVLCEIAIAACDLAEIIGAAIALNLLFHLPLLAGVLLTACDTLFILWFARYGIRLIEAVVLILVVIIGGCFAVEILYARPDLHQILTGFVPIVNSRNLYIAIAILGATVMPHNLYLHSALVQTRRIGSSQDDRRQACKFNLLDSAVALNLAFFVNAAILIVAASVFFTRHLPVTEIAQAHLLLTPLLGTALASALFAIALLASGQSSTLTGTLAGQIVMEGFLNFRIRPWLRRLITRLVAIVPAALTIYSAGEQGTYKLLIFSQVILSMQLPFAIVPLIHFTNDRRRMGIFANKMWVRVLAWVTAVVIVGLNIRLLAMGVGDWIGSAGQWRTLAISAVVAVALALAALLLWITLEPVLPHWFRRLERTIAPMPEHVGASVAAATYGKILVPLDHTDRDPIAIAHAVSMARLHHARLYLLHVEEDVTSQLYGSEASTAEVQAGGQYLDGIMASLRGQDFEVEAVTRYSTHPPDEIVKVAKELGIDLLVMGAHGHKGLKDIIFGATINVVRHKLDVPILVVRDKDQRSGQ